MTAQRNEQAVRAMYDGMANGNPHAFLDAFADDAEFRIIGRTVVSGTYHGKQEFVDGVIKPLGRLCATPLELTPASIVASGDTVVAELTGTAMTSSGILYENSYCQVFRLRDGMVCRLTEYLDTEAVTAAFGPPAIRGEDR